MTKPRLIHGTTLSDLIWLLHGTVAGDNFFCSFQNIQDIVFFEILSSGIF
jgi:hypothetical protein